MNVVIIEDEINNVEVLKHLLATYCKDMTIVGVGSKVNESIDLILELKPDLILLDVELEDGTGFEVLKGLTSIHPKVIFITGYEHYAIEAIKSSAIDYILKPVNIDELQAAIEKAKSIQLQSRELEVLQKKVEELAPSFLWLNDLKKSQKVDVQSIEYIKADSVYSEVHLDSGDIRYTSFVLAHFEKELQEKNFYRIHRSYLINLSKIVEIEAGRGGHALMSSGEKLPIAYRRKASLKQLLN